MTKAITVFPEDPNLATKEDASNCYANMSVMDFDTKFANPAIQLHYEQFRMQLVTIGTILFWLLVVLSVLVDSSVGLFFLETQYSTSLHLVRVVLICRILLSLVGIFLCLKIFRVSSARKNMNKESDRAIITQLTNVLLLGVPLVNGLLLCWLVSRDSCHEQELESNTYYMHYNCNTNATGGVPLAATLTLFLSNLFIVATLRSYTYRVLQTSFLLNFISAITAIVLSPTPSESLIVLVAAVLTAVMGYSQETYAYSMFKALLDGETTKRLHSTEMQHFIGNVGHDLKTPLHGISLSLDTLVEECNNLLSEGSVKDRLMTTLEGFQMECSFLDVAINRTVDYSKGLANIALQPHTELISIQDTIQWAVDCVGSRTQNRIPVVILPFPTNLRDDFMTDKQWFLENLLCYLTNAVKFSSGGRVTIRASLEEAEGEEGEGEGEGGNSTLTGPSSKYIQVDGNTPLQHLRISVEDQGIGVTAQQQRDGSGLFKQCRQTDRRVGGAGLGLYCLKTRVEALGGKVGREDRADGLLGSVFWFSLPIQSIQVHNTTKTQVVRSLRRYSSRGSEEASYTCEMSAPASAHNSISIRRGRPRAGSDSGSELDTSISVRDAAISVRVTLEEEEDIEGEEMEESDGIGVDATSPEAHSVLIVEDSVVVVKATSRMLQRAGYKVDTAENGAVGLEKMKAKWYEVVLMDIQMPIMDGLEATRRIREYESELELLRKYGGDLGGRKRGRGRQFIIGVSANGADNARSDALESGMCDFTPKPFSFQDLCDMQARRRESLV